MTTNPLDEIQARADAATEGPWYASPLGEVYSGNGMSDDPLVADEVFKADSVFIAHAREDVPKLVAALRAVEAVHRNEHRDKNGRKSETPTERGGFCYGCGWYGGAACPMITALREALG